MGGAWQYDVMEGEATATELVEAARLGSEAAWSALVRRYSSLVLAKTRKYGLSQNDTDDVYQFVWIKLVEHLDTIREPERLAGWIATTTDREAMRVAMRRKDATLEAVAEVAGSESVESDVVDTALLAAVLDGLDRISERCRSLLRMIFVERSPYTAISDRLDMAVGSIGPTRQRCIAELRAVVNGW